MLAVKEIDVAYEADNDFKAEIGTDGEEQYHDADDEDSDCIIDQQAGMQGRSNIEQNGKVPDKQMEYEMVPK
jgi:hypothetical protein